MSEKKERFDFPRYEYACLNPAYIPASVAVSAEQGGGPSRFSVKPGDNVKIIGELIHPIAMDEGLKLAIREGGHTIASGQVTKIIE